MRFLTAFLLMLCALPGCTEPSSPLVSDGVGTDTSPADTSTLNDALWEDASATDVGVDGSAAADGSAVGDGSLDMSIAHDVPVSAGVDTAWGTITGACGQLSSLLATAEGAFAENVYTFTASGSFDASALGAGPKKRFEGENAGGSSVCSEVMSMQLLLDCEGGVVVKTENEIIYASEGKKADYLMELTGQKVGVSVTRAYKGPAIDVYTADDATQLLEKKLLGMQQALTNVAVEDAWSQTMVHVWTLHPAWALTVALAWEGLDPALKKGVLVLVTVEEGSDAIVTDSCDD